MLTPFGRLVATGALALVLLTVLLHTFVLTHNGQDFFCGQAGLCLSAPR